MDACLNNLQIINENYKDWLDFLISYNKSDIAFHSLRVAYEAKNIAYLYDINTNDAYIAGCLHDLGNIFSEEEMIDIAENLGLNIYEEERKFPVLLHQKLSSVLAKDIFKIDNDDILKAIECHSTLKSNPSKLELILFIADKLSWNNRHYKEKMYQGLNKSLEYSAYTYMEYLNRYKDENTVIHPWFKTGFEFLKKKLAFV